MKKQLGDQLRRERERRVMTQEELAKELDIPVRSLQDYEANRAVPRQQRRRAIIAWLAAPRAVA